MIRKTLAVLMALALVFALAAGCGNGGDAKTSPEASAGTPAQPSVSAPVSPPGTLGKSGRPAVSLPLTETVTTFTWWQGFPPPMIEHMDGSDVNPMFQELEKRTGIDIEWIDVPASGMNEAFMILLGSSDYPDIMNNLNMIYPGGAATALKDEVIIDIAAYKDLIPNYMYYCDIPEYGRLMISDDGSISQFSQVNQGGGIQVTSFATRSTYLKELGMEAPTTYDELHDYLAACKAKYGNTMYVNRYGCLRGNSIYAGYDIAGTFGTWGPTVDLPFGVENGKIVCSFLEDNSQTYLSFLKMFNGWWSEGLLDPDFTSNADRDVPTESVLAGKWSVFPAGGAAVDSYAALSTDEDLHMTVIVDPSIEKLAEGETLNYGMVKEAVTTVVGNSITTGCENVELLVRLFDYLYSEEGSMLANFGVLGQAFEYDEDGEPYYTDLILRNDEGLSSNWALFKYCYQGGSFAVDARRNLLLRTDEQNAAFALLESRVSAVSELPTGMERTADESSRFSELYSTIDTYLSEMVPQFVMGTKPLGDWDSFITQLKKLGIEECMSIYQASYDRFMARSVG